MYLLSHDIKRFRALKRIFHFPVSKVPYENLRYKYNIIDGIHNTFQQKVSIVDSLLRFRQTPKLRYKTNEDFLSQLPIHSIKSLFLLNSNPFYNLCNNSIWIF